MKTCKQILSWTLRAAGILCAVLFLILIALNLAYLYKTRENPESPPALLGVIPFVMDADTMSQSGIRAGDLVLCVPPAESYAVGDIVVLRRENQLLLRRVAGTEAAAGVPALRTANDTGDDWFLSFPDDVAAVYSQRIPEAGGWIRFLKNPWGLIACLSIPILLLALCVFWPRRRAE